MPHILLVTEDPAMHSSARNILSDAGYMLDVRSTCAEALRQVRQQRPAAIMVDVALNADGCCDVVRACRKEAVALQLPILVLAATPRAAIRAIRAGAQGCVRTPIEWSTLAPMLCQVKVQAPVELPRPHIRMSPGVAQQTLRSSAIF
jgi:CheY-like chemotaxis protein